jgi:putative IMPACT (imprinted ancient) family translation regulator
VRPCRVTTEAEARAALRERRRQPHEARHHCFAYVLGDDGRTQKSSDDGEPAGTAGVPMLEVLRRNDIEPPSRGEVGYLEG